MRTRSLLQGAVLATAAAAQAGNDAYLWTVDTTSMKENTNSVASTSSFAAERIIARRKGVTDLAYMHITDESILQELNQYGGWQQPLFGAASSDQPAKVFIRVTGFTGDAGSFNALPDLWIENPETTLLTSFDAKFDQKNLCEYHIKPRTKPDVSVKYTYFNTASSCLSQSDVEMLPEILAITATVPVASGLKGSGISSFHRTLIHLAMTNNLESTLLVLPPTNKLRKPLKSELKKRSPVETPLDLPYAPATHSASGVSTFKSNSSRNGNHTLPRNIPQWFTSVEQCTNTTNACSGHGKCVKAHGSQYHCKCSSTIVRTNKDGSTKSVKWGGNACQKKDISSEFLLFAGFGIFFTAVIAGAMGMMFNMGSQQLPSVIGAGVVGPRAQR